ncbi:MAG: hypothetical protein LBJ83_00900 [Oscillospiraceae bacterium]|jgi:hypothetical protein|nr:hypothetical protein [Oscillospiraceae bacterium]
MKCGFAMDFKEQLSKTNKKNLWTGFIVAFFILVGLFTVVGWVFGIFKYIWGTERAKERLTQFIMPVLLCDPPQFAEDSKLSNDLLLEIALNNIFVNGEKKYAKNDEGEYIIPQSDFEISLSEIFGTKRKLVHQNLRDLSGFYCTYRSEEAVYYVQLAAQGSSYVPQIANIKKKGNVITLTVNYVRLQMLTKSERGNLQVDKSMLYTLKKEHGKYILLAVKDLEASLKS